MTTGMRQQCVVGVTWRVSLLLACSVVGCGPSRGPVRGDPRDAAATGGSDGGGGTAGRGTGGDGLGTGGDGPGTGGGGPGTGGRGAGAGGSGVGTGGGGVGTGGRGPGGSGGAIASPRDVDMLFVIDDSVSMSPLQAKLRARMPDFISALQGLPGGLPNLHLAVISTSLGAGLYGNVTGCQPNTIGNLNGAFQHATNCTALRAGEHFIKSIAGVNNFTGNMADVFNCIANIGAAGCGFEHHFESTRLALNRAQNSADAENAGFLRPNALLVIVMLTNEDDCSVDATSMLFDPNQTSVMQPLGGLQSYRCNEFGHKCDQAMPHTATGLPMTMTGCKSAEDGQLVTVDGFVRFLKSLKSNPDRFLVAAIAGPVTPYTVGAHTFTLGSGAMESQPWIEHSCTGAVVAGSDPEYADPGIRLKQWIDAFGANGIFSPICADDFQSPLSEIATAIASKLGP